MGHLAVKAQKRLTLLFSIAVAVLACWAATLIVVDITNDADPSGAEKWFASWMFQMKVAGQRPRQSTSFTTTDNDLDRASTMYQQMCSFCHGAARGHAAPFAESFSPRPPQFVIEPSQGQTWMDAYVIKHGIRWTGMPSFRTLSDSDTWHLALYVEGRNQPRE